MEWDEANGPHPIVLLPSEIRRKIMIKLCQRDIYNYRLVCREWNSEVKEYYSFSVHLNEDSPVLKQLLQLRITGLQLRKIVEKRIRILERVRAAGKSKRRRRPRRLQLTFKHPNLITRLSTAFNGQLSTHYLNDFLRLCHPNLTCLDINFISHGSQQLYYKFPSKVSYNFQNLKELQLCLDFRPETETKSSSILTLINNSKLESLTIMDINFMEGVTLDIVETGLDFVLKLLMGNPKGFEELKMYVSYIEEGSSRVDLPDYTPQQFDALNRVVNLKTMNLDFDLYELGKPYRDFWRALICRQVRLEKFRADTFVPIRVHLLNIIISNNYEFLVDIKIENVMRSEVVPFDLSLFAPCQGLKTLNLCAGGTLWVGEGSSLVNFTGLPQGPGLRLTFDFFKLLTKDLMRLFDCEPFLRRIQEFRIGHCGHQAPFGFTIHLLDRVWCLEHGGIWKLELFKWDTKTWSVDEDYIRREIFKLFLKSPPDAANSEIKLTRLRN